MWVSQGLIDYNKSALLLIKVKCQKVDKAIDTRINDDHVPRFRYMSPGGPSQYTDAVLPV